jgi:hypothetical protein
MAKNREAFPDQTQFLISNMVVPPTTILLGGVSAHSRYLDAIGADGLEITPLRPRVSRLMCQLTDRMGAYSEGAPGAPIRDNGCSHRDQVIRRIVKSFHSGFRREEEGGWPARVFPSVGESLSFLTRVQRITGKLPAVLYPDISDSGDAYLQYDDTNAPFAERTFQPKASDWHGIFKLGEYSEPSDIKEAIGAAGFTGITGDMLVEQDPNSTCTFKDPVSLMGRWAAAGLMPSFNLSLNRTDITGRKGVAARATHAAKQAFMKSPKAALGTSEGRQLQAVASGWKAAGYAGVVVYEEGPLHSPIPHVAQNEQQRIIATAREVMAQAPAA